MSLSASSSATLSAPRRLFRAARRCAWRYDLVFRRSLASVPASVFSCALAVPVFVILAAACGAEPQQQTQSFAARPTPTPDAAQAPTSTPQTTPIPTPEPAPTPEPPAVPIAEWDLDTSSTGGSLAALLSEDERSCLRTALADRYDAFRDAPLIEDGNGLAGAAEVADCLTPESFAGFVVAMFSATAGGLSGETRSCLADVFVGDPRGALAFAAGEPSDDAPDSVSVKAVSCFTPEEAAAMTPEGEGPPPDTAGLRCLTEELMKLDGGEDVLRIISTADPAGLTQEQSALLGQAVNACGIETEFTFPDPAS